MGRGEDSPSVKGKGPKAKGDLGAYIKERRSQLNLRQRDLAKAIDAYDRNYVNQVESGRIALPQHEMRQKIARALHVREVDLLVAAGELDRADLDISDRVAGLATGHPVE